jgi:hypothetical protein
LVGCRGRNKEAEESGPAGMDVFCKVKRYTGGTFSMGGLSGFTIYQGCEDGIGDRAASITDNLGVALLCGINGRKVVTDLGS